MFTKRLFKVFTIALVMAVVSIAPATATSEHRSTSDVYWWWDRDNSVGTSTLLRTPNGISANFEAAGLPANQAVTLWFIVFNNPEGCMTTPCSVPADVFNPNVQADFLWGAGHVIGGGDTTLAGHLQVGDTSKSGMAEIGFPELPIGLSDPMGAEVHLATHSHGPAQTGQDLAAQISSFTGGCVTFLGPNGFASAPGDVPANEGECSTIQVSVHQSAP